AEPPAAAAPGNAVAAPSNAVAAPSNAVPAPGNAVPAPGNAVPAPGNAVAKPLRLSFTSSSAFGVTHAKFFNQLVGARLDYRYTPRFAFGAELGYANLKGKDGRVSNVLPEVTTEYRVPLKGETVGMPLRFSLGFLPKNGPTLRLGAGFDFGVSDSLSFELIPLEPMVWITRDRPEVSLNAHVGVRIAF
ncbi:MAG TPA: hypothetical protein VNG33_16955, partial [Polyangiaceae bacterium]|nr:hypothetical protein [Polyangiaceae bacterium]